MEEIIHRIQRFIEYGYESNESFLQQSENDAKAFAHRAILENLVSVLNCAGTSIRGQIDALRILNNVSMLPHKREDILSVIQSISYTFESKLIASEGKLTLEEPTLHTMLLTLLCRATNFSLSSSDVMELVRQDTSLALSLVFGILEQCGKYEIELVVAFARLMVGFTQPSTYFHSYANQDADEGQALRMHDTEEFTHRIDQLSELAVNTLLIVTVGNSLREGVLEDESSGISKQYQHEILLHYNNFLQNLYHYGTQYSDEIREHLATPEVLFNLLIPYVTMTLQEIQDGYISNQPRKSSQSQMSASAVTSVMKTIIIATFRAPIEVVQLVRESNFTYTSLQYNDSLIHERFDLFILIMFVNINIDAINDGSEDTSSLAEEFNPALLYALITDTCEELNEAQITRLLRAFENTAMFPLTRDVPTYYALHDVVFNRYEKILRNIEVSQSKAISPTDKKSSKEQEKKIHALLQDLPSLSLPETSQPKRDHTSHHSKHRDNGKKKESQRSGELITAPKSFYCAINHHIMAQPMRAPSGHVFEKDTIEHWLKSQGSVCPITHEPLKSIDLHLDRRLQLEIKAWKLKKHMKNKEEDFTDSKYAAEDDIYDF